MSLHQPQSPEFVLQTLVCFHWRFTLTCWCFHGQLHTAQVSSCCCSSFYVHLDSTSRIYVLLVPCSSHILVDVESWTRSLALQVCVMSNKQMDAYTDTYTLTNAHTPATVDKMKPALQLQECGVKHLRAVFTGALVSGVTIKTQLFF